MAQSPIRPTDEGARQQAKNLLRKARSGSLASIDSKDGFPAASLVSLATDFDGTPLILVSRLTGHTRNLLADPRASLLIGDIGKGDPLAHARISLFMRARALARGSADGQRARRRFLARNPKAALYADFGDFLFVALELERAGLNGGFGKAFELLRGDVCCDIASCTELMEAEEALLAKLNADKTQLARLALGRETAVTGWRATGIDPEGIDLARGDARARYGFGEAVGTVAAFEQALALSRL